MLEKFQKYYLENNLFLASDNVLLTVSGGKDSMLMLHLFKTAEMSFGVAHCNFQLRGDEADNDEAFVRGFCEENNIDFHSITFDTKEYAAKNGVSIQMAARDLRYAWFEEVRVANNYQYIATAHHKNDVAETMLINLTKGTGLAGLHGIKSKQGKVIRPLLCFSNLEIKNYIKEKNILYREDLSNSDNKYTRNAIRHDVIPVLEKINPNFIETTNNEAAQFLGIEQILFQKIEEEKNKVFSKTKNGYKLAIESIKKLSPLHTYLYYFLKEYNFNKEVIIDIFNGLDTQSGKIFYSSTHQLVKDRTHLFLTKIDNEIEEVKTINKVNDFPFEVELIENFESFEIKKDKNLAYLDADLLSFPMMLRTWKNGDSFKPLGMKGNKKVSDFLIDNKVVLSDKNNVKVLSSQGTIIWLVGYRISEDYKISSSTKRILILRK